MPVSLQKCSTTHFETSIWATPYLLYLCEVFIDFINSFTIWIIKKFPTKHTQPFHGPLSRTNRVNQYEKKHSQTHTYTDYQPSFISFFHLLQSIASSLFSLHALQSFCTTYLQFLCGLPLGLEPSTSCSIHFSPISLSVATHAHTIATKLL